LKPDPEFVIHSLRHAYLTRLGGGKVAPFSIMNVAGHSDIKMAQRYSHPTPELMESAVERLDSLNQEARKKLENREERLVPAAISAASVKPLPVSH
jgi:integrase